MERTNADQKIRIPRSLLLNFDVSLSVNKNFFFCPKGLYAYREKRHMEPNIQEANSLEAFSEVISSFSRKSSALQIHII